MAYNSQIPQPNDRLKDSQPQILGNFQALGNFVNSGTQFIEFPNGTVMMWEGNVLLPLGGNNTVPFPSGVGIPTFQTIYTIIVIPVASGAPMLPPDSAVTLRTNTLVDMVVYAGRRTGIDPVANLHCNYIVIGLKA